MEANTKVTEAEKELQAGAELAAVGSTVTMVCQMADFTAKLIGGQGCNLPEQVVEALRQQIGQHFGAAGLPLSAAENPRWLQPEVPATPPPAEAAGQSGSAAAAPVPAPTGPAAGNAFRAPRVPTQLRGQP